MSKFDDMIYRLKEDIEVPDHVWAKYTETLSTLPDKQEKRHSHTFSKTKIWPVVALVALIIGTLSVSAAAYIQWSKGLEERLQATQEQRQTLENNQMSSYVGQSVTQGDITVTVQQSIVDNYFAYLSFKVEGYKVEDGVQPGFSDVSFRVNEDDWGSGGWSEGFYGRQIQGDNGNVIPTDGTPLTGDETISYIMDDGSMEYLVVMMSDKKGCFIDKPIHVELKNLGTYDETTKDIAVDTEGSWCFDWILTGSNAIEKYELQASLENNGTTVLEAEFSPISISLTYEHPKQEILEKVIDQNGEEITHTIYKKPPLFTGVRLKDGTIYTNLTDGWSSWISGYAEENSDIYECTVSLKQVIDVEQVESLLFIKSYPEDDQPLTEENLYFVSVK